MQGQCAAILLSTLFLTTINVDSKRSRNKGLNVYNIERWHAMKSALNNNETRRSLKSNGAIESNQRTLGLLAEILFCELVEDCDESPTETEKPPSTLPSSPPQRPTSLSSTPSTLSSSLPSRPTLPSSTPLIPVTLTSAPPLSVSLIPKPTPSPLPNENSNNRDDYIPFPCVSHTYKFHKEQLSWNEAQWRCQEESGQLMVIENGAQYDSIMQLVKFEMKGAVILHAGFSRDSITNPWKTVYGNCLSFEKWASCEANHTVGDENCGGFIFVPNGPQGLNYGACNLQHSFVCEKRPSSNCG